MSSIAVGTEVRTVAAINGPIPDSVPYEIIGTIVMGRMRTRRNPALTKS